MAVLEEIKEPITKEMKAFEPKFKSFLSSRVPLVDHVMRYLVRRKGKQIRPILVFLTARLVGEVNESTYRGAALIELMHTATLVHDDVVDDANQRRGFFSINALWKNKIAVLIGDYLLSRVLLLAVETKEYDLLQWVSGTVKAMSEGELLQIEKARKLDITEDVYYEIIEQKTASLIQTCCAVGAASVKAPEDQIEMLGELGRQLGLAFQIKDDLFDFEKVNWTGKPSGIDIKEQKMTLPLIVALRESEPKQRKYIIKTIKKHHDNPKKVEEVVNFVRDSGGLSYARTKMMGHIEAAQKILTNFKEGPERTSLEKLLTYTTARKK